MRLVDRVAVSLRDASDDGSLISYLAAGGDATRLAEVALLAIERAGYRVVPADAASTPPARKASQERAWHHFAALSRYRETGQPADPDDFGPLTLR